jgi:hypothetical protein
MGWMIGVLDPSRGWEFFSSPESRLALGPTQPPIHWVSGALSLRIKWTGSEAYHSPPSSAKIKNVWSYISTPQYAIMAWCLVKKHRDKLYFTFIYKYVIFVSARHFPFKQKSKKKKKKR